MDSKAMHTVDVVSGATAKFTSAAVVGVSATPAVFGITKDEWQVVGIISGVIIGLLSIAVNAWVRFKIAEKKECEKEK